MNRRNAIWGALAVLGSLAAALAAAEAVVRAAYGDLIPLRAVAKHYLREPDPRLGFRNRPNADFTVESRLFGSVRFETNSRGLRERKEIPYEKPPGQRRLAVLGDSFAYGVWVNEPETFAARIEAALPGWEVLNAGVVGWRTDQELAWLLGEGFRYEPDAVAIFFCLGNDFVPTEQIPHLLFEERGGALAERPGDKSVRWRERSALKRLALDRLELHWFVSGRLGELRARLRRAEGRPDDVLTAYAKTYPTEAQRPGFEALRALLREARRRTEAEGARLLLVAVDYAGLAGEEWWRGAAAAGVDLRDFDPGRAERLLEGLAEEEGIAFLSPSEALRRSPEPPFLPEDGHYSPAGHARVAEATVARLRELGWAEP